MKKRFTGSGKKILGYHSTFDKQLTRKYLSPDQLEYNVSINRFKRQINLLNNEWLVTVDDGFKSDLVICDLLNKEMKNGIFFISPGNLGKPGYLNKSQLLSISKTQSIGSHSFTHSDLTIVNDKKGLYKELHQSKEILEQIIGSEVPFFAPPHGKINERISDLLMEIGYTEIYLTHINNIRHNTNLKSLSRVLIKDSYSYSEFKDIIKTSSDSLKFKRVLRNIRTLKKTGSKINTSSLGEYYDLSQQEMKKLMTCKTSRAILKVLACAKEILI